MPKIKSEIWQSEINNLVVYEEISNFHHNGTGLKSIYTKNHPGMLFKVRHAGDPLLVALNLSPTLNFGLTSSEEFK